MKCRTLLTLFLLAAAHTAAVSAAPAECGDAGPFSHPSSLPYGLPAFGNIKESDYLPAIEAGMCKQRAEVAAIAANAAAPDFENTIVALERSGELFERAGNVFFNLNASNTTPKMQEIEATIAPKIAAHLDEIYQNPKLYARVDVLYRKRASLHLDPESLQLLERYHLKFVRAGAPLAEKQRAELRAMNQELSALSAQFKRNLLQATREAAIVVDAESDLDGLSPEEIGAAARAAATRGLRGKWLLTLQNTTTQPALRRLTHRELRERLYKASINRAQGGATDNAPVIAKMVTLRARLADLLGYPSYAAYELADASAGTPKAVRNMFGSIAPVAVAQAKSDAAELQKLIDADAKARHTESFELQPWDWQFYAERLRKLRYRLTEAEVKPYFELNHVLRDGVFYAAHELYGLTFKERKDLPAYHPDVRVFEVFDANGAPLALFLADFYARDNKQGGGWTSSLVRQSKLLGTQPLVLNNMNVPKPLPGQPTLLRFIEVTTIFHELGHALHWMLSNVRYPSLSGTNVPADFVELPSQFNEMWAREPQVLAHFARHYRTNEPMPTELLHQVLAAQKFDQGYATTEAIAAALLDQAWHQIGTSKAVSAADVPNFEAAALREAGLAYGPVPPRYHSTYFFHIFANRYGASYYAYMWSEILARDAGEWMHAHGGLTRANGEYFRDKILSRGRSAEPGVLFQDFYGRTPDIRALLEYRGLMQHDGGPSRSH